jgi:DNA-binding transcriptional ArsR family regulator
MRSDAPRLLPVLRSQHQADLPTMLLLHPHEQFTIAELVQRLAIPQSTVSVEVRRLADTGIVNVRPAGRSRLVSANGSSPLAAPPPELLMLTYGPHVVIQDEFASLADVAAVVIFGSWAARYHGERGLRPNDVDVLVVGTPNRIAMFAAAEHAEARLRRPVNPTVCPPAQWAKPTEPFIQEIASRPYVTVIDYTSAGGSK